MQTTSVLIIVSTLLGSWLGAFVIPLDWERPWQVRWIIENLLQYKHSTSNVMVVYVTACKNQPCEHNLHQVIF